jgi:GDP-L-fucose synthase
MKKILLTGGNGFIGRNIRESFLAKKYEIISPSSSELNLIDSDAVDKYFKNKTFDVILHAATKPGHRNAKDPTNLFYSNIRMFENLVRHKGKFGKFINFGSGAIYDISQNISLAKEEDIYKNIGKDDHSFCKYVIQKRIETLPNFVDLNIFGIFGKYEDWEIRFISNAICKAIHGLPITLKQNRRFSYLYIDDLMPILEFFIENKTEYNSYNITPDYTVELLELAKIIQNVSRSNIEINIWKEGHGLDYTGDNTRLRKEMPLFNFTNINIATNNLLEYYIKNIAKIDKMKLYTDK